MKELVFSDCRYRIANEDQAKINDEAMSRMKKV